jgi:hypothetical protein
VSFYIGNFDLKRVCLALGEGTVRHVATLHIVVHDYSEELLSAYEKPEGLRPVAAVTIVVTAALTSMISAPDQAQHA